MFEAYLDVSGCYHAQTPSGKPGWRDTVDLDPLCNGPLHEFSVLFSGWAERRHFDTPVNVDMDITVSIDVDSGFNVQYIPWRYGRLNVG
jgi:hypothetical protein